MSIAVRDEIGIEVANVETLNIPGRSGHGLWQVRLQPGIYFIEQDLQRNYHQTVPAGDEGYRIQVLRGGGFRLLSTRPKGYRGLNFGGLGEPCRRCPSRVLFSSDRQGDALNVYRILPSGRGAMRLTRRAGNNAPATFDPWANKIAFASDRDGNWEIYTMSSNGARQANITNHQAADEAPSWGLDGIVFQSDRDGNLELYRMMPDGSQVTRLTNNAASDVAPSWSPDGSRIAFGSNRDGNWEIYILDTANEQVTRLTDHEATDRNPTWSPDGQWIAFETDRDGQFEIYKIKVASGELVRLTNDAADDTAPVWAPYCERIYFESDRGGEIKIYRMEIDGSSPQRLEKSSRKGTLDLLR